MGALSDAFWQRVNEVSVSILDSIAQNAEEYHAASADEVALWDELTAPHNYPALVRYVALCKGNEYAGGVLTAAKRRWKTRAKES